MWFCVGSALFLFSISLSVVSTGFEYGGARPAWLVFSFIAVLLSAGAVFVVFFGRIRAAGRAAPSLALIVIFGLAMRAVLMPSTPIYEDDFYRYLWDGGVTANGLSPYRHAPARFQAAQAGPDAASKYRRLARDSGVVIERVNHPSLKTIYPPLAQAVFAAAHVVRPWSVISLRGVFFLFDAAALVLVVLLLRRLSLPASWAALWWWNPLVLKEVYNSAHMDVVIVPLVLGALYAAVRGRHVAAAAILAAAVGVKLWPVILLPLLLRGALSRPGRLAAAGAVFLSLSVVILLPVAAAGFDEASGFLAYGRMWEMNDALYMMVLWGVRGALTFLGGHAVWAHLAAGAAVGAALAAIILGLCRRPAKGPRDLAGRCLWAVAALFLLSPTQFPWYYIWVIPFLALTPRLALLLPVALLGLYYLRFPLAAAGHVGVFDYGVVFVEFVPVWVLLAVGFFRRRSGGGRAGEVKV